MPRQYLIDYRKENGIKAADMAERLGLSESYYSQIENGKRQKNMDIALVAVISKVTGIPLQEIVEHESCMDRLEVVDVEED